MTAEELMESMPWRADIVRHYEARADAGLPLFCPVGLGIIAVGEPRVRTFLGEEVEEDDDD